MINIIVSAIIPSIIAIIILVGMIQKKDVYNLFIDGAKDGLKISIKMFPILIGIFLAVGMLRESGLLEFIAQKLSFLNKIGVPSEILPISLIRPISGSASIALGTDLMKIFTPDSKIGMLTACIMASSETTFYVIALYTNSVKAKNTIKVIIPAILADITTIIVAIMLFQ